MVAHILALKMAILGFHTSPNCWMEAVNSKTRYNFWLKWCSNKIRSWWNNGLTWNVAEIIKSNLATKTYITGTCFLAGIAPIIRNMLHWNDRNDHVVFRFFFIRTRNFTPLESLFHESRDLLDYINWKRFKFVSLFFVDIFFLSVTFFHISGRC